MTRDSRVAAVGLTLLLVLLGSRTALSHSEADAEDKGGVCSHGVPWSVHADYRDIHTAPHLVNQSGMAEIVAAVVSAPHFRLTPPPAEGPTAVYSLKLVASLSTPLTGLFRAEAQIVPVGNKKGYRGFARAEKRWSAAPIDAQGQLFLAFGVSHTGRKTQVGHRESATVGNASASDKITDVYTSGTPQVVLDEETGELIEVVRDGNGDIVWEVPPTLWVRLTSSVTVSGGVHTYTYRIENFGNESLDFVIPEITTPLFPSGWYGSVDSLSYEQTSFGDQGAPYYHNATLSVTHNDDDLSSEQVTTGQVYVPEDRLVFGGTNAITAAYYDPVLQANVVRFTVSEDADLGLLLRADPTGEESVDEVEGVLAGLPHELLDYGFLPGVNEYRVRTGSGVNGWQQTDAVPIVN